MDNGPDDVRVAACACGGLRVTLAGPPLGIYACCCLECQRATGSAFAVRARFAGSAVVSIEGEHRQWRRGSEAGRWLEHCFCPACGGLVFMRSEAAPDMLAVSVGCFADPGFGAPATAYWTSRKPGWCMLSGVREIARQ
jgi:hypothetical protein